MKIRRTNNNDLITICALESKYLGETLGFEMLENELNNPVAYFYTALIDDTVVGYIGAWIIDGVIEVINLVVDEAYQRKGIGTALINTLLNTEKTKEMILDVRTTNLKALNFYHKLGFKVIATRKAYYKNGDDAYTMKFVKEEANENLSN